MQNKSLSWISFLFQGVFFHKVFCFVVLFFKGELWLSNPSTKLNHLEGIGTDTSVQMSVCPVFLPESSASVHTERGRTRCTQSASKGSVKGGFLWFLIGFTNRICRIWKSVCLKPLLTGVFGGSYQAGKSEVWQTWWLSRKLRKKKC